MVIYLNCMLGRLSVPVNMAQYDAKHAVFYAPYVSSFILVSFVSFRFVSFRFVWLLFNFACSGAPEKFKWQARHDTVRLNNTHFQRRRGPDGKSVNPCESCWLIDLVSAANHWVITSFTKLGDAAVAMTSGSGSFIEACMRLGALV